jgi:hypothetical protein
MTTKEIRIEHEHIYQTRLGILGVSGAPTANQHNMAVAEADKHIFDLLAQPDAAKGAGAQPATDVVRRLSDLRNSL